jgi:hypothetical protein
LFAEVEELSIIVVRITVQKTLGVVNWVWLISDSFKDDCRTSSDTRNRVPNVFGCWSSASLQLAIESSMQNTLGDTKDFGQVEISCKVTICCVFTQGDNLAISL